MLAFLQIFEPLKILKLTLAYNFPPFHSLFPPEDEQLRLKRLHFRKSCSIQHLDKKFLSHLSEMHPTSALHELCQRLGWPAPVLVEAFGCGPPTMRMSIFKVNTYMYPSYVLVQTMEFARRRIKCPTINCFLRLSLCLSPKPGDGQRQFLPADNRCDGEEGRES